LLDDLSEYPVTVIAAPAGVGKSTLAAEWSRRCGHPCAWLALDEADREPAQLWRSLAAALDEITRCAAGGGSRRATLVIDDLDRIDGEERACAALASFVEHRPAWVHLLLLSRRRPPLPVDRLRAGGELADIHFEALRFSDGEAVDLLMTLCPDISAAELSAGVRRAGGWAAALQLTALSIRSHRHTPAVASGPGVVGPERLVDEYLWAEVLGSESPELIALLLSTAVVGRLNSGLAEALTQRPDAVDLLEEAEERGLFVASLDDGGWFEVHSLVRDILTTRFERRWPAALREQHGRAAEWFESVGDELSALDHWLRADRPGDALRVLADLALSLFESGRSATLAHGVDRLPPEIAAVDDESAIRYAWCQLVVDRGGFLDALTVAGSACADADPSARARLEVLRAAAASLAGDWERSGARTITALEGLPDRGWTDPVGRFGWRLVTHAIAFDERWDDTAPVVSEARAASSGNVEGRWAFEGTRALGLALAGHPLEAQRVTRGARQAADSGRHATLRAELALADALVAREVGDRPRAQDALHALAGRPSHPVPALQLVAQLELVRLRMSSGQLDAAGEAFSEAETLCERLSRPWSDGDADLVGGGRGSWLTSSLARVGVDLSLAADDPDAAARSSHRVADPFWRPVCEAKVHLARGRPENAVDALALADPRCSRHEVLRDLVSARAVAPRDRDAAAAAVRRAMETAARHGMLQSVASEGVEVLELVELAAWCVPDGWMDRLRHALLPTWAARDVKGPIDDLTDRERDVLRLLPSRLTLREISSELYVSQNTLKFHLRAIYRKLGAESRAGAVDSARQMRLLPRG
jgi:LuxR family maltose regulon positive regulatory protein